MINQAFLQARHPPAAFAAFFYFGISFMVSLLLGARGLRIAADLRLDPAQPGLMAAVPICAGVLVHPVCPPKQGPLPDGLLGGPLLVCPLHDRTFDLRAGESLTGDFRLLTYPGRQAVDGQIMLAFWKERVEAC